MRLLQFLCRVDRWRYYSGFGDAFYYFRSLLEAGIFGIALSSKEQRGYGGRMAL